MAITPVEDAGADKQAVSKTKTWKITITLKEIQLRHANANPVLSHLGIRVVRGLLQTGGSDRNLLLGLIEGDFILGRMASTGALPAIKTTPGRPRVRPPVICPRIMRIGIHVVTWIAVIACVLIFAPTAS